MAEKQLTTVTLSFSYKVFVFDYYNEFNLVISNLNYIFDFKFKCAEIAYCDAGYVGVIFVGKRPSKKELKELVERDIEDIDLMKEFRWGNICNIGEY